MSINTWKKQFQQEYKLLLKVLPFQDLSLINQAFTHTSYKYENPNTGQDNEKLELLGDSLLNFLSCEYLYHKNPEWGEGEITKLRSSLVDNQQLAKFARELNLGQFLNLGKGEEATGGRDKISNLSQAFEALIGAYYLDAGLPSVRDFIHSLFDEFYPDIAHQKLNVTKRIYLNPKGELQEKVCQVKHLKINPLSQPPIYKTERSGGTDNQPLFTSLVYLNGELFAQGKGGSKKEAEKQAAEMGLRRLEIDYGYD